MDFQEIVQSAKTLPNEVQVTILNHPPPSCANIPKKKKKKKRRSNEF
jgi:hypothetical protein